MGCLSLLQGIFQTQGLNPGLLYYRQILYHLSHEGSLVLDGMVNKRSWNGMIKPTGKKPSVDSRSMTFIE